MNYYSKTYRTDGGNEIVIASGGKLTIESGATITGLAAAMPAATITALGGVNQMPAQADSTATDAAGVVTDFNALLAKLRDAGLLAAE